MRRVINKMNTKFDKDRFERMLSWSKEANHINNSFPILAGRERESAVDDIYYIQRNIRRQGNHIYFYDYIDEETQMIFYNLIKEVTRDIFMEHIGDILNNCFNEFIFVHLNSPGGRADCGLAIYDFIKTSSIPISCIVEGSCDSAATLLFLASHHREMTPNSTFMMHQCSWGCYGQNRLMQDMAINAEKLMMKLRKIYFEETSFGKTTSKGQKLSDEERMLMIQQQLEHDIEWSYSECKKYDIIDTSLEELELSEENQTKVEALIEKLLSEQISSKNSKEKKQTPKKSEKKEETTKKKTPTKKPTKKVEEKEVENSKEEKPTK